MITCCSNITTMRRAGTNVYPAVLFVLVLTLAWPGKTLAQNPQFGVAPSARTQQAISDPPTRSKHDDEGLDAAVGVAFSQRSNVRRESVADGDNDDSDTAVVVTPEAGYKRAFGRHSAEVGVTTEFTRFQDFTNENTDNYTVNGLANLDITRILDLDLFTSFTDAVEPRGGSGTRLSQDIEPDEVEISRYGGEVTVGRRAARIQLKAGASRSQFRYQNNEQDSRDRNDERVHSRVLYNISPRTSVFAGASLTDVTFQAQGVDLDSEELGYEVGGRWEIGDRTTGRVSVGRTEKDFDNPQLEDSETTTLAGRLSWSPRQRTTFNVYGSRQFEETTSLDNSFFVSELIGASVNQAVGSRWIASAYINRTDDDFESERRDKILDYGFGLSYKLRRWLSLGVQYSVIERESNIPGNDFDDEVLSLLLNGNFELGNR